MIIVSRGLVALAERNGLWYIKPAGLFQLHPWLLHHKWRAYVFMNTKIKRTARKLYSQTCMNVHMCLRVSHKDNIYLLPGNIWGLIQVQYCVLRIEECAYSSSSSWTHIEDLSFQSWPVLLQIPLSSKITFPSLSPLVITFCYEIKTDYLFSVTKVLLVIV